MDSLITTFTDTSRLHHRYHHRVFESFNLHRGQARLFLKLIEPEGISQRELAQRMNITPATLTRMIQNLEKNGFVERKPDPDDQRILLISLTEEGVKTREIIHEKLQESDNKIFKNFTQEEKLQLEMMLLKIQKELIKNIPEGGCR